MLHLSKIKFFFVLTFCFVLTLSLSSCTSGGGGGGSGGSSSGGSGGLGTTGGSSSGGSSGGGTTTGGTTGGTTTGGTTTGSSTGGGVTGGGSSGGGSADITQSSVSVNASSGLVEVPFTARLNDSVVGIKILELTIGISSASAFQIITSYPGVLLVTDSLTSPSEDVVVPGPNNLLTTLALTPATSINTLNYQTRGADPEVVDGDYKHVLLLDSGGPNQVSGVVVAKSDGNLNAGNLDLNVHLVGDDAQNSTNRQIITDAIAEIKSIYTPIGVSVSEIYYNVDNTFGVLPNPILGSSFYADQSGDVSVRRLAVNLYIGDTISREDSVRGGNPFVGVLGIASSIPGPALPTAFSVVAVSISEHQGPDGVFSDNEKRIFAETMAHETGHYLGLFHPVEPSFDEFDPLADTAECISETECRSNGVAANLMYPTAISGLVQRDLTSDQNEVVNRNVLVD